jgi:phytoene dehydrogenase-like protein
MGSGGSRSTGAGNAPRVVRAPRRVLVIGAGHNGLVAAIRLAAAGHEVIVLEQGERPGGAVTSSHDTLPGFVHDRCAGFLPLTLASPAFDGLDVRERIDWVNPSVAMAHPFLDGTAIALHRDVQATADSLEASAPGAGRAWEALVAPLIRRRDAVLRAALSPFPPIRPATALAVGLRRDGIELARRMLGSAASFGRDVFGDERATAWLCGSTTHADLTPGSAGGGALGFFLHLLGHLVGWPFPRGGVGRLSDALVARLVELGGHVHCGAPVAEIVVQGRRVRGVRLASGETLRGDAVVATVSAAPLAAMLAPGALRPRLTRRLQRWRYGLGTFKADFALAAPVPWTSAVARRAGVVHLGDTLEAMFRAPQEAGLGRVPTTPTMVVGQHTLHDPTRAPEGRHTLYVYTHLPQRPDLGDDDTADRIEERIEAFAPGFRDLVLARATRSPADLERDNPSLVGGDLGGGSFELDQQLCFRPAPELFRGRTPLAGLYMAGASVHPGGGVHGVSGHAAARALLADSSRLRFWR